MTATYTNLVALLITCKIADKSSVRPGGQNIGGEDAKKTAAEFEPLIII